MERNYDKVENSYKYLLKLPMDSVSIENFEKLMKEKDEKDSLINKLEKLTNRDIWLEELKILEENYKNYKIMRFNIQNALEDGFKKDNKKKLLKIKK
jgi:hypothetical protein